MEASALKNISHYCKGFSDATNERLKNYIGLATSLADKFDSEVLSTKERQQAALLGIARALETHDPSKASELTWVYTKGRYAIKDAIRNEKKRRSKIPISKQTFLLDGIPLDDLGNNDSPIRSETEDRRIELLRAALKSLDPRIRKIVKQVCFEGKKQREIAAGFGISQSWCSRLYHRGLDQMREYIVGAIRESAA